MKLGALSKGAVVATVAALSLAACSAQTGVVENTTMSVAWNQPLYSFNQNTTTGNATANAIVLNLTQQGFNYYDNEFTLQKNTDFGTYEKVSDDPLTVKYTINEGVTWSDGVAVDAADLLLNWAGLSGSLNEGEPAYDEETGVLIPGSNVWFDSVAIGTGIEQVTQVPEVGDDGRSITLVYDTPQVDWELLFTGVGVPAHVVAKHGLNISDPAEAKKAVLDAIQNKDTAKLKPLADFWSIGFDAVEMPTGDKADITLGNGAYTVTDFKKDEYITLTARTDDYKAGPQPSVETVTVRFIPDAMASVTALQNGEVAVTQPQATTDVLDAAKKIDGVSIIQQEEWTYEHLDLVFNNGGPFDPATYGGDEAKALAVRQAFLTAIDTQEVVDKLILPLNPDAKPLGSQLFLPGAESYDASAEANGSAAFGKGDAEAAKKILADAGVTTPIDVNFLYGKSNTRRAQEYALYAAQVEKAGFNLIDGGDDNWGALLGSGTYDASLFAWQSTSTGVTSSRATFDTEGGNNFTGYSNTDSDKLWAELSSTFDADRQQEILKTIDKSLYADAYGVSVFAFPQITAYNSELEGISSSGLSPTFFWNYWDWKAPVKE
ncbi:ABC transporter family substrate-binding protein [Demequina sp.]|uniref:ABC transporter family substrate-binding protein n=1 Tax=Demequina sp. TaxID=2050685 RepID=UPI003D0EA368